MKDNKTVFIHIIGKSENEHLGEADGKARILELLRAGYGISRSVFSPDDNTVYVTMGVLA